MNVYIDAERRSQTGANGGNSEYVNFFGVDHRNPRRILASRQALEAINSLGGDHKWVMDTILAGHGFNKTTGALSITILKSHLRIKKLRTYKGKDHWHTMPLERVKEVLSDLHKIVCQYVDL